MFALQHVLDSNADRDRVWAQALDPVAWPSWFPGAESVRLPGPPSPGAKGLLKIRGHGLRSLRLLSLKAPEKLVWRLSGFLRQQTWTLTLVPSDLGTVLTLKVEVTGAGAWMDPVFRKGWLAAWVPLVARALAKSTPQS